MATKIDKQAVPIFYDEDAKPIATVLYTNRHRIIYLLKEADEEEIVDLYKNKDSLIKTNEKPL